MWRQPGKLQHPLLLQELAKGLFGPSNPGAPPSLSVFGRYVYEYPAVTYTAHPNPGEALKACPLGNNDYVVCLSVCPSVCLCGCSIGSSVTSLPVYKDTSSKNKAISIPTYLNSLEHLIVIMRIQSRRLQHTSYYARANNIVCIVSHDTPPSSVLFLS